MDKDVHNNLCIIMLWRTLAWMLVFYMLYLLFGAGVYYGLEYTREETICQTTINSLTSYIQRFQNGSSLNITEIQDFMKVSKNSFDIVII